MRKLAIAALVAALIPVHASALQTDELLGLVAMPLAVAAVADVAGVPADDLASLVVTLNQANVPPTQFVQVIRYAPVALVVRDDQPDFVQFVRTEYDRGITGTNLVTVIDQRLSTYQVDPVITTLAEPATTFVVADDYIPPVVITRVTEIRTTNPLTLNQFDSNDLLALVALPLAVSAVANLSGVPESELANLMMTLNQANVAPVQIVEVLRYAPVALVRTDQPSFVQFVRTEVVRGVTGPQLVSVIGDRLQTVYDVTPQFAVATPVQTVVVDERFIPPVVVTRVAEARAHPHGGPPGQLKKELGLQTGAEVVHGTHPSRAARRETVRVEKPRTVVPKRTREVAVRPRGRDRDDDRPARQRTVVSTPKPRRDVTPNVAAPRGQGKKDRPAIARPAGQSGKSQEPGQGKGQGKGKGKGKG